MQRQTAVTAYVRSEQLLLFIFSWQHGYMYTCNVTWSRLVHDGYTDAT